MFFSGHFVLSICIVYSGMKRYLVNAKPFQETEIKREQGSHARGVYPTRDTSAKVQEELTDTRMIAKEE